MKLVFLGATGLVGRGFLRYLKRSGLHVEVHALVRRPTGLPDEFPFVREYYGELDAIPKDLFPAEPHVVIYFALKNVEDGQGFEKVNVDGCRNVLAALPPSCQGIIYGSSLSDYGQGEQLDIAESFFPKPVTALAKTRIRAQALLKEAMTARSGSLVVLRPRLILDTHEMTLERMIRMMQAGIALGSGRQRISLIEVEDYAQVILHFARLILTQGPRQRCDATYNVGYLEGLAFDDLEAILASDQGLKRARFRIPVSAWLLKFLNATGRLSAIRVASWFDLMGLSKHGSARKLQAELGGELLQKDPRQVFAAVLRRRRQESQK